MNVLQAVFIVYVLGFAYTAHCANRAVTDAERAAAEDPNRESARNLAEQPQALKLAAIVIMALGWPLCLLAMPELYDPRVWRD